MFPIDKKQVTRLCGLKWQSVWTICIRMIRAEGLRVKGLFTRQALCINSVMKMTFLGYPVKNVGDVRATFGGNE